MKVIWIITLVFAFAIAGTGISIAQVKTRDMSSTTSAGSTTVDRSFTGVDVSKNTSIGVGSTTVYSQPSQGGSGPVQGSQRGSTSESSRGVMIERRF